MVKRQRALTYPQLLPPILFFYTKQPPPTFYSQDTKTTIKSLPNLPLQYKPPTHHIYTHIHYILLPIIIHKKTAMPLHQYVHSTIYHPLPLNHT
ncbi:serine hydrolase, partial [Bacillus pumilus]|uniref:serine hydrolase n=1 Tax=Bacillus pumilus TaxID=1408 RepID=UPI0028CB5888